MYTDKQVKRIIELKNLGLTWKEVVEDFNLEFDENKTANGVKKTYQRYKDFDFSQDTLISNMRKVHSARKARSNATKENKALLEVLEFRDDLVEEVTEVLKNNKIGKVKLPKPKKSKKKKNLAIEMLISDIHIGLKTKSYNLDVAERRISEYTKTTLEEIERLQKNYNVVKAQINLNGDLMQGAHLHGNDSQVSCEFSDAKQMAEVIRILFFKVILPVAKLGIQVDILGMVGNHDRQSKDRPIHDAGERYLTYTIYKAIEMLSQTSGLNNVSMTIPTAEYSSFEMFGHHFIIEHGHAKGIALNTTALEKQLLKRANQLGIIAKGIRIGHFHTEMSSNNGRHVVAPSPTSGDCYGDHLGFVAYPAMMLNYYVETESRNTSFYHTFCVNLEDIK